ncbi:TfoX/Sxy family protein [Pelagicoccus sp. SDUM812003]|uniref:TfoX/Sxy family protein n=1 Tax=Pelagicoccus sp. SDUM812003 TaxID=3041267 RepID=UPI00280F1417|nr:TfoX/Sxy family protein [Pelagicoccus sp. SDUM812003]MDQ8204029.1 TfoX/Sxy family protein [Pelagicoccus sp. SDUM812003]
MAYSEALAEGLRQQLLDRSGVSERKMFGGVCFFLNGNMLCGTADDWYMFRVGKELEAEALRRPEARSMNRTGRKMGGFIEVDAKAVDGPALSGWIAFAERFVGALPGK